jgi:oligopeptide/dipeptide ABC transporter ATP-binding protein
MMSTDDNTAKMKEGNILEVENLKTYFQFDEGVVKAVDGVSFELGKKKTLGIVGESGCGKSVTARSLMRIVEGGGDIVDGTIRLRRQNEITEITKLESDSEEMREIRGNDISMIFQEPMTAFSPIHNMLKQVGETLGYHKAGITDEEIKERVIHLFDRVGIPNSSERISMYPFELSGGLRQRAMIAMGLACSPDILIADEPTTALDVTIQAQIIMLLKRLQREEEMAIIIISHDLGVIAQMAENIAVMYLGKIIEYAEATELFDHPKHPYTQDLLKSIPRIDIDISATNRFETMSGDVPDPFDLPSGCSYHTRCSSFIEGVCDRVAPTTVNQGSDGHTVACHLYE